MGMQVMTVKADGLIANLSYNALNISAVMVISGVMYGSLSPLEKYAGKSRAKIHV